MRIVHAALALVGCFGCAQEARIDGTATVVIVNGDRVPLAAWPVAFQGADGRLLALAFTNEGGIANGPMEPGGMVTYRGPFLAEHVFTHGNVQVGDRIANAEPVVTVGDTATLRLAMTTTNVPAAARLCRFAIACGDDVIDAAGVPGYEIRVNVPARCAPNGTLAILATATDDRAQAVAFSFLELAPTVESVTSVDVNGWRDDFIDLSHTIEGLGGETVRMGFDARISIGNADVWIYRLHREGSTDSVTFDVRVPAAVPGKPAYRFTALSASGERIIEQPLGVSARELPPRITTFGLRATDDVERPVVEFATERSVIGEHGVDALLLEVGTGKSWTLLDMPGPTARLPELPAAFAGFRPEALELGAVAVTTRTESVKGEIVQTTAKPNAPSRRELPL